MPNQHSIKSYLVRAVHEWCLDNSLTPYLVVHITDKTVVPAGYSSDGEITLNIGPNATHMLKMGNEAIEFTTRFNSKACECWVPIDSVTGIYAKENMQGMTFQLEIQPVQEGGTETPVRGKPNLSVVETSMKKKAPPAKRRRSKRGKPKLTLVE